MTVANPTQIDAAPDSLEGIAGATEVIGGDIEEAAIGGATVMIGKVFEDLGTEGVSAVTEEVSAATEVVFVDSAIAGISAVLPAGSGAPWEALEADRPAADLAGLLPQNGCSDLWTVMGTAV